MAKRQSRANVTLDDIADETEWPSVKQQTHEWERDPATQMSRTQARKIRSTYEAAVVPDIADLNTLQLDNATLAELDDASRTLTEFDVSHGNELANFSALLLRSESAASSQIENLTASARAIVTAELEDSDRKNSGLIVANTRAMTAAIDLSDRLNSDAIIRMHDALLGVHSPHMVGKFRDEQVWIGGSRFGPFEASFVPPHHSQVAHNIDDLCRFMARDDLPVLAQAAIAHAQFETIHPFPDGNGRTGRALVQGILRGKGVTRNVTVPISAGLLGDTDSYFAALTAYQQGDPQPIARQFANASFAAVTNGTRLASDLETITTNWADKVQSRRGSGTRKLLAALPGQPVINLRVATDRFGLSPSSAARAIEDLVESGILQQIGNSARNRKWAATEILNALDDFAARAHRRT